MIEKNKIDRSNFTSDSKGKVHTKKRNKDKKTIEDVKKERKERREELQRKRSSIDPILKKINKMNKQYEYVEEKSFLFDKYFNFRLSNLLRVVYVLNYSNVDLQKYHSHLYFVKEIIKQIK